MNHLCENCNSVSIGKLESFCIPCGDIKELKEAQEELFHKVNMYNLEQFKDIKKALRIIWLYSEDGEILHDDINTNWMYEFIED